MEGDGYFTGRDRELTVSGGRTLTLRPRGHMRNDYPTLIYDEIAVFDGDTLIQTITENSVIPDERYLFEGFPANYSGVYGQDVNFDGAEDFGLVCGTSYNGPLCWFVWDQEAGQFRFAFFSCLDLRIDWDEHRQIDAWRDGSIGTLYQIYEYNGRGERIQVEDYYVEN